MKVQSAIIKLILWTSKTLASGECPILLQVSFNGTKRVSTHFSCTERYWDKKNECVKKGYPNYNGINEAITKMKNDLIAKKLEFEKTDTPYNAELLISSSQPIKNNPLSYVDIMNKMFIDKASRYNTKKGHIIVYEKLVDIFGRKNFLVSELTNEKLIEVVNSWQISANTMITYTRAIRAIIQYSVDNGYIQNFPNKGFQYIKNHYRCQIKHKSLTEYNIFQIQCYVDEKLNENIEKLLHKSSKTFAISFFYCIHKMFGLAPVDAMKLKDNQLSVVDNYYKIETTRSKTAIPVKIFVHIDTTEGKIIQYLLQTSQSRGGYIFPLLNESCVTEEDKALTIKKANIDLNKVLRVVANELQIQPFTLYSARHTFASLKAKEGISIGTIAKAMSRSVAGIDRYVKNLLNDEDLKRLTF